MSVKKKKVLVLYPGTMNRARIALAVPLLLGIAKDQGWEVKYFDTAFYEKEDDSVVGKEKTGGFMPAPKETLPGMIGKERLIPDVQKVIDDFKPEVVAITAMTCDYQYLMTFFPKIKLPKKTTVIIGGNHATFMEKQVVETGLFDVVCIGQGEKSFEELLQRMTLGNDISNIENTIFRDRKSGKITQNKLRRLLSSEDLWEFPLDYSFFDQRYYKYPFDGKTVNMFWLEVGRGCPFNCTYCGAPLLRNRFMGLGQYLTVRPIDSIFETIKQVNRHHKIDIYNITHECFLAQPNEWLEEFVERWSKEVKAGFLIQTRVETITQEKLDILKRSKAPTIQIGLGIESGSKRILEEICNRKMRIDDLIRGYDLMNANGFRTNAYYMIGLPTETREEIFETIELCGRVKSHINSVNIFQPYPELPLTKLCIEKGYMKGDEIIPSVTDVSILNMPMISSDEIGKLRRTFMLYAKLPKKYWPDIEKCEKDYENNKPLYDKLLKLRWKHEKASFK